MSGLSLGDVIAKYTKSAFFVNIVPLKTLRSTESRFFMFTYNKFNTLLIASRYDVRGRSFNNAVMWSDTNAFGPRAFFVTGKQPAAALQLDAVQLKDAGVYRCRVDFRNSPTRNFQVKLTVIGRYLILL